jgi:ATP-dependent DNA helicase RecQ
MAYGLADVVNQRRMIDESPAGEEFKRLQRAKLDALLALAEAHDCRRARLLAYFGEKLAGPVAGLPQGGPSLLGGQGAHGVTTVGAWCGNCDNCLEPPRTWDATEAARKALSCIYRFHQHTGLRFGAGHLIDVLRGKATDKVAQYRHERLSTWAVGAELSEAQWRSVVRQLVALGYVRTEGEFNTLELAEGARAVLKGEVSITLREPSEARRGSRQRGARERVPVAAAALDGDALQRFAALKAWRADVAREHNLPAYVVFHDATLAQMAAEYPTTLEALSHISGVGAKKLDAYGREILRVLDT